MNNTKKWKKNQLWGNLGKFVEQTNHQIIYFLFLFYFCVSGQKLFIIGFSNCQPGKIISIFVIAIIIWKHHELLITFSKLWIDFIIFPNKLCKLSFWLFDFFIINKWIYFFGNYSIYLFFLCYLRNY
jgi:hypothetical protein